MKKEPFLLLEILIAFFLVSLCIVPLIERPLELYRCELARLEGIEKERLADWTFSEVKERLLKNEIPWKRLPHKGEMSAPFPLSDVKIQLPHCKSKTIHREFVLTGRGEKVGKDGAEYRQLGIFIHLDGQEYQFRLPVQKLFVEK